MKLHPFQLTIKTISNLLPNKKKWFPDATFQNER